MDVDNARKLEEQGDHAGAAAIYRRLLAREPANVELLNDYAAALLNVGSYDEAAGELARAIALAPEDARAHINLAMVQFMLGRIKQAGESAARAFELAPGRQDYREAWDALSYGLTGFQDPRAPERQVFMSAVVDLLKDTPHLSILEIGSYMGASLLTWANAVNRLHGGTAGVVCVDAWGAGETAPQYMDAMAEALVSNQAYDIFLRNSSRVGDRVTVKPVRSLSEAALPPMGDRTFDIVYVDGSHLYRSALFDITEGRRLVKDGGILCGDDLELQPDECDLDNARRHAGTDYIRDPRSGRQFHPGVTLAIHELFGRVSSFSGFWAMRKAGGDFVGVSLAHSRGVIPPHWPRDGVERIRAYFRNSSELGQLLD